MSKKPKLTPWFPGDVKPARPGVYERCYAQDMPGEMQPMKCYCYWNGKQWMTYESTPEAAAREVVVSDWQHEWWRGLAEQP